MTPPTLVNKWKAYPEYRASGIKWLGEIPEHWEVTRLKRVSTASFSSVDKHTIDGEQPVRLCNYVHVYYHDHITSQLDFMAATATPEEVRRFTIGEGDVLVTKDSEEWNDIAVPAFVVERLEKVLCGYHLALIRAKDSRMDGRYLFRAFSARGINDQFRVEATGITRYGLSKYGLDNALFLVPPVSEQRAIAAFLDRETARVDALIEKKQRQIELLEEKRAALIDHAVTKGLNPNVKMKESGIRWLGEIPAHWKVARLGLISSSLQTGPFGSQLHASDYIDDGCPVINPANLQAGQIVPDARCTVSREVFDRLRRHQLIEGDIIFGRRGEMGRCAYVTKEAEGFLCGTGSIMVRLNRVIADPRYVALFLGIQGVRDHLLLESVGSTMDNLNTRIIGRIPLTLPPVEEQVVLAGRAARELCYIKHVSEKIGQSMELLREHRAALISAAVAGKIDVRERA